MPGGASWARVSAVNYIKLHLCAAVLDCYCGVVHCNPAVTSYRPIATGEQAHLTVFIDSMTFRGIIQIYFTCRIQVFICYPL